MIIATTNKICMKPLIECELTIPKSHNTIKITETRYHKMFPFIIIFIISPPCSGGESVFD